MRPCGPALLFCPADRPDRVVKAAALADSVIVDLEDAVAPTDRAAARRNLAELDLDPARTIVRLNAAGTDDHARDVEALRGTRFTTIMLAKAEGPHQLDDLAGLDIIALCETALGVEKAYELASHERTVALMWGAEDLVASLEGRSSRHADGRYRDVARAARTRVLLAAGAAGVAAIDAVHLDIADADGLAAEVEDAAASGFSATACIHPSQVPVIRDGYAPTDDEIEWADAVLARAETEPGVFRFRGRMVDEPVLRQARRLNAARN
ncbi:CoA ester lyase [Microbacterium sp. G2-8]|uniref:HpcH/HpaI aldolase/citrate lyase family protein n=1 Tax=Microbacterium sp. G2-8 TaxID=2842454 RepID=UPI001C8989B2|nr:CoA ester lyase [Microbacterium sp. G2-8]